MQGSPHLDSLRETLASSEYEPVSLIARGGMANVYRVEHRFLRRAFALKLLHPSIASSPGFVERLFLEAKILGRLNSPHIVEIVDLWVDQSGVPLMILELLEGQTIEKRLRQARQLPIFDATEWILQLLEALQEAHAEGLVHRDLKPANLFLHTLPGAPVSLKVLDFGLARVIAEHASPTANYPAIRTTTGAVVGSPSYVSPEGLRGERVDERADLFAVGIVLYEMLLGFGPFDHEPELRAPRTARAEIPSSLEDVLRTALAEDPTERFQSAAEFASALRETRPNLRNSP